MTERLRIYDDVDAAVLRGAEVVRGGGVVVYPTETFYGLAADPSSDPALRHLASIKDRGATKPIPLIAASLADCERLAPMPAVLRPLCVAFWPGPLTLALEPFASWPPALLGGGKTLGVRVSSHPLARALAAAAGGLITSTSANPGGKPPVTQVDALDTFFASQVDLILDGGPLHGGQPSTVVFSRGPDVVLLRAGAISQEQLSHVLKRPVLVP